MHPIDQTSFGATACRRSSSRGCVPSNATAGAGAEANVAQVAGAVEFEADGGKVSVPMNAQQPVTITGTAGTVQVGLPTSATAQNAVRTSAGTVVYPDAKSAADVAVQTLADGSVRALVAIQGAKAPREYRFPLSVPTGATVKLLDNGGVGIYQITDRSVEVVASLSAPWAKDANGRAVPTRYRLDGDILIQEVDHQGAAYPVVADPSYTRGDFKAEWQPWSPFSVTVYANVRGTNALMVAGGVACGGMGTIPIVGGALTAICAAGVGASGIAALYGHCTKLTFNTYNRTMNVGYFKGGFCK